MTDPSPSIARVIVRPPNWLGDAVLALPAIAGVRRHFAGAHLTIAAAPAVAALFREDTGTAPDAVVALPERHRDAVRALASIRADLVVLMPNSIRSAWQSRRAGIAERWGIARGIRGLLLTRRSARPNDQQPHQADFYRALVRGLDIACDDAGPSIRPSAASLEEARALLATQKVPTDAPLIAIAPGAAYGQAKQWPPDRAAAVIARVLRDDVARRAVIVGADHDRPAARAIESWLRAQAPNERARVIDLAGRTTLGALTGVTARCQVFISNDSGAMHLAAALGRPVVAIFGPTDERATRPLGAGAEVLTAPAFCRPCMLRDCPIDHRCMTRITVDAVHTVVARKLAGASV